MSKKLFVVGHPVAHSKSPDMHNAAYRALGLDWSYGFADCLSKGEACDFFARRDWLGINVTMPWKPLAFEMATWCSSAARLAGGANVLVRRDDELLGDNTDGKGCAASLRRRGVSFDAVRAVVCGTGATSLAIVHAVAAAGAAHVALLGRDDGKTRRVLDAYRERADDALGQVDVVAGAYENHFEEIARADVILDATPLGMNQGDPAPFDTSLLSSNQVVFDVVYAHGETALIAAARAAGCEAYDGSGMLVAQAVETVFDLIDWLDAPVDAENIDLYAVMAEAAGFPV